MSMDAGESTGAATTTAAPDEPPKPSWVDLPDDLVLSILSRIPCKDDRSSICRVCRRWRAAITGLSARAPPPRPFPWLVLPSRDPAEPFRLACVLSGCVVHQHHASNTFYPPGARFVGSYDGTWLFLHYGGDRRVHRLLNFSTYRVRDLPSLVRLRNNQSIANMFMLAATLSSSPGDPNCIGAAIIAAWPDRSPHAVLWPWPSQSYSRCLAFWRMGATIADGVVLADANVKHMDDVVYHDGAFNVLVNYGDHILECKHAAPAGEWMNLELRRFRPAERIYEEYHVLRGRYLVESRGELLKVIRLRRHGSLLLAKFRVFRATRRPQMPVDDDFPVALYPWEWSELDTLGGRILFVGYGCSRSYEADQYPGLKAGIYFLDDGKFYDEGVLFRGMDIRPYPYPCSDTGMWSDSEGRSQSFFHGPASPPVRSSHSPPAWLLP